jgi:hypothetical protein
MLLLQSQRLSLQQLLAAMATVAILMMVVSIAGLLVYQIPGFLVVQPLQRVMVMLILVVVMMVVMMVMVMVMVRLMRLMT